MREQMQEQERREQQQKLQAAQFMQQRVPVSQTPAINVSVPTTLPSAAQVPMEVLKVRECCSWLAHTLLHFLFLGVFIWITMSIWLYQPVRNTLVICQLHEFLHDFTCKEWCGLVME